MIERESNKLVLMKGQRAKCMGSQKDIWPCVDVLIEVMHSCLKMRSGNKISIFLILPNSN